MADYIVKDTELTSVANAIRTAGGTSSLLNFPNGFVSAVNNISGSGGGSSDFSTAEVTITVSEALLADEFHWLFPIISSDKVIVGNYVQEELTETHSVALYKGECEILNPMYSHIYTVTSGNALVSNSLITITGDCILSCTRRSMN